MEKIDKKILVVEDDSSFRWIIKQSLAGEGFFVVEAEDGEKGLEMAETEKPDLILLDILLPKMDGLMVAKKIKEKGIGAQIIFLTNLKDTEHITEAVDITGKTDYIIKTDTHIDQVVARVKARLGIK